ncbi:MAG: hypothetical protein ACODAB_07445 [Gemmatimonadota bacterium]
MRPHDVCVALQLVLTPESDYRGLAAKVGVSLGEAHNAVKRLQVAHLVLPHRLAVNRRNLLEYILYGVPYSFPGELGAETLGVPTAHSSPAFREKIAAADVIVWPSVKGTERGVALQPLCSCAPDLPAANPKLYRWLAAIDVLRVGRARERTLAKEILEPEIAGGEPDLFSAAIGP